MSAHQVQRGPVPATYSLVDETAGHTLPARCLHDSPTCTLGPTCRCAPPVNQQHVRRCLSPFESFSSTSADRVARGARCTPVGRHCQRAPVQIGAREQAASGWHVQVGLDSEFPEHVMQLDAGRAYARLPSTEVAPATEKHTLQQESMIAHMDRTGTPPYAQEPDSPCWRAPTACVRARAVSHPAGLMYRCGCPLAAAWRRAWAAM